MKELKDTDEIFILLEDTPYHKAFTIFYEEDGFLRKADSPGEAYRLSRIGNLSHWFKRTTLLQFKENLFGRE